MSLYRSVATLLATYETLFWLPNLPAPSLLSEQGMNNNNFLFSISSYNTYVIKSNICILSPQALLIDSPLPVFHLLEKVRKLAEKEQRFIWSIVEKVLLRE